MILASASPRRREILVQLGIRFEVVVPDVPELEEGDPEPVAAHNARAKARAVGATAPPGVGVLAADTVVGVDGRILPKPRDAEQAAEWLGLLSGREHSVVSAICLVGPGGEREAVSTTAVRFRDLTSAEIDWYIASGEWRDKAGGYAIQGRGAALVESIRGDYWTVVGLPVASLIRLLGPEALSGS